MLPIVELSRMPPSIQLALAALVLAAAVYDVRSRRIPNWLSAAGLCAGLALRTSLRGWRGLKDAARANPELDVAHPAAVTLPHGLSIAAGCLAYLVLPDLDV